MIIFAGFQVGFKGKVSLRNFHRSTDIDGQRKSYPVGVTILHVTLYHGRLIPCLMTHCENNFINS